MGLFVLWWGWLAFNSGSTYGLSGEKWQYAAQAAVTTMMSSFGGGTVSILYTMIRLGGRIDALDIINGILGSLVSITAGCFLYQGNEWVWCSVYSVQLLAMWAIVLVVSRFNEKLLQNSETEIISENHQTPSFGVTLKSRVGSSLAIVLVI